MTRYGIHLDEKDYRKLKAKLALQGKTVSGWIRKIIKKFIGGKSQK